MRLWNALQYIYIYIFTSNLTLLRHELHLRPRSVFCVVHVKMGNECKRWNTYSFFQLRPNINHYIVYIYTELKLATPKSHLINILYRQKTLLLSETHTRFAHRPVQTELLLSFSLCVINVLYFSTNFCNHSFI